ncbi:pantoate--beta-alanine ligase [Formicincola oecophyllae]|uniref:Pantothenate synthetase n=2 Tax=Formicincola oecophyllae TaxID=2558361 RepID=A0A4Y6UDF1_9PROT|nr:pantoate--beta-alanine ligase [Formicincola oecophyllae]
MKLCATIEDMRQTLAAARHRQPQGTVGFVPTMGNLHQGHLSLVERARAENGLVVVSLFVNPVQFDRPDDLATYPRTPEADLALLAQAGVDIVFMPPAEELYPPGFATTIEVGGVAAVMEGPSRPGHFNGVATVLCKLFNIVAPERAYFGQKDAQQVAVVRQMVRDLNMDVAITACPIWREGDGLAASSRNSRLSPQARAQAPVIHQALESLQRAVNQGVVDVALLEGQLSAALTAGGTEKVEYATLVDPTTFTPLAGQRLQPGRPALALVAAWFGGVRLIDNKMLEVPAR